MDALFDETKFVFQFPIWLLIHPTALSQGLLIVKGKDGERGFPIFTDQDLAARYQASVPPIAKYVLGMASGRPDFKALLEVLRLQGIPHVCIDPSRDTGRFHPVDDLCAAVETQGTSDQPPSGEGSAN